MDITTEEFLEQKVNIENSFAQELEVPPEQVNVEIVESRRTIRRNLQGLNMQVTIQTNDARATSNKVSQDGFASDVSSHLPSDTTIGDVSEPEASVLRKSDLHVFETKGIFNKVSCIIMG